MRLLIVVEGQTEEAFVGALLVPHLAGHGVFASATIVGTPRRRGSAALTKGGGNWSRWERDLRRILGEQRGGDVRVTTLFDLYGLPRGFPGLDVHASEPDTTRRCELLEDALFDALADHRLIPYLQRHEFEALVLAALPSLHALLDAEDDLQGLQDLQAQLAGTPPEDINDGKRTAPSKRLLNHIPSYSKTLHGPLAIEETGLTKLRALCPRFNAWLTRLESLSTP